MDYSALVDASHHSSQLCLHVHFSPVNVAGMLGWASTLGQYALVSTRSWPVPIFSTVCGSINTSNPDAVMHAHIL